MLNDEAVLVAFLLGMAVGVGMALTVVGWKIRHMRSVHSSPPSNQPIAILHPLATLKAVSKQQWQNGKPLFNSSWKS
jgi:hypothetical protein